MQTYKIKFEKAAQKFLDKQDKNPSKAIQGDI